MVVTVELMVKRQCEDGESEREIGVKTVGWLSLPRNTYLLAGRNR